MQTFLAFMPGVWHFIVKFLCSGFFLGFAGNMLAWVAIVVILWSISRHLAPSGAPSPSIRERLASALGLGLRPEYILWIKVKERLLRRAQEHGIHGLIWSLENLQDRYLYAFPLPGPPPQNQISVPLVLPIDPANSICKPELIFVTGSSKNFKTKTIMAIAQALDQRNERILASPDSPPGLVHLFEFYAEDLDPDRLMQKLIARVRERKDLRGDLLFVIDIANDWTDPEIVRLVARILSDPYLERVETEATIVLVVSPPPKLSEMKYLEWLQELCDRAGKLPGLRYPQISNWQVRYFSTVHLGADTVIERVTEDMFEDILRNRKVPFLWRLPNREGMRISLKRAIRDLVARIYEIEPRMQHIRSGNPEGVPDAQDPYHSWSEKIFGEIGISCIKDLAAKESKARNPRKQDHFKERKAAASAYLRKLGSCVDEWNHSRS